MTPRTPTDPVHVSVVLTPLLAERLDRARASMGLGRSAYLRALLVAATARPDPKAPTSEGV